MPRDITPALEAILLEHLQVGDDKPQGEIEIAVDPLSLQFTDTSPGDPTSWSWDFGDGGSSTEQNPIHTYATGGTYTVTLDVDGPAGPATISHSVTVP